MPATALDRPRGATGAGAFRFGWTRSRLRESALLPPQPGLLSLAGGLPASELIPRDAYATALREVLARDAAALQYGQPYEPLRECIVELMRERGVDCAPQQVLLTSGAQQALSLVAQLLVPPGGQVLIEEQVYTGIRQAAQPYRPSFLTVRTDADTGMDVDRAWAMLKGGARPAFLYTIADTHNPCGVRLGREKRARLVALARRFGFRSSKTTPTGPCTTPRIPCPPSAPWTASGWSTSGASRRSSRRPCASAGSYCRRVSHPLPGF